MEEEAYASSQAQEEEDEGAIEVSRPWGVPVDMDTVDLKDRRCRG